MEIQLIRTGSIYDISQVAIICVFFNSHVKQEIQKITRTNREQHCALWNTYEHDLEPYGCVNAENCFDQVFVYSVPLLCCNYNTFSSSLRK